LRDGEALRAQSLYCDLIWLKIDAGPGIFSMKRREFITLLARADQVTE
jgi:hypothetical protein